MLLSLARPPRRGRPAPSAQLGRWRARCRITSTCSTSGWKNSAAFAQHGNANPTEALDPDKLERLRRYEVHLDRKLERMLTMLLRLKELRQVGDTE